MPGVAIVFLSHNEPPISGADWMWTERQGRLDPGGDDPDHRSHRRGITAAPGPGGTNPYTLSL